MSLSHLNPTETPRPVDSLREGLPDRYMTPEDIAELFDVSVDTVYGWRRKRTGPPGFRIGKHLRYDPTDVAAYVRERRAAA